MAKTKSSAKHSKAAAPTKRAAPKAATKPAPKSTQKAAAPKAAPKETKTDWSSAIKKALQDKGEQPQWPGSGDAWKRKNKI